MNWIWCFIAISILSLSLSVVVAQDYFSDDEYALHGAEADGLVTLDSSSTGEKWPGCKWEMLECDKGYFNSSRCFEYEDGCHIKGCHWMQAHYVCDCDKGEEEELWSFTCVCGRRRGRGRCGDGRRNGSVCEKSGMKLFHLYGYR